MRQAACALDEDRLLARGSGTVIPNRSPGQLAHLGQIGTGSFLLDPELYMPGWAVHLDVAKFRRKHEANLALGPAFCADRCPDKMPVPRSDP